MLNSVMMWDVDPEIFKIGAFSVRYYGLLFATGMVLGYLIEKKIFLKEKMDLKYLDNLLVYIVVGTVLGARLGHCLFYDFEYFSEHPLEILLPFKNVAGEYKFVGFMGLASHGGAIGVLIAIILFCRKYAINVFWLLDRLAIAIPVAGAFIRFGNFMNSEIYGKPTNGSWGVVFMKDDLIPRHPTQLYEAVSYLLISLFLYICYKKGLHSRRGVMFGIFLILLFSARFLIEFYKENQVSFEDALPINMGQILSIPFIIAGITLILFKYKAGPTEQTVVNK
jgi:phosphatidylglycerol:prolipoprotein diacylglycerol transferase